MGVEPTTATLATWRSTTELHPQRLFCITFLSACKEVRDVFASTQPARRRGQNPAGER